MLHGAVSKVLDLQPHGFLWQGPYPKRDVHLPADRNAWSAGWSAACGHLESRYRGGKTAATCGECERDPLWGDVELRFVFLVVGGGTKMANPTWRCCLNLGKFVFFWGTHGQPNHPQQPWLSMDPGQLSVGIRWFKWFSEIGHAFSWVIYAIRIALHDFEGSSQIQDFGQLGSEIDPAGGVRLPWLIWEAKVATARALVNKSKELQHTSHSSPRVEDDRRCVC